MTTGSPEPETKATDAVPIARSPSVSRSAGSTIRLGIAPSVTTVPATCASRSSVEDPGTDAGDGRDEDEDGRQGEVVPTAPRCSTPLPEVVGDRLRPQVVGDAVQGGAEFVGHASAPISSASSGASARSRPRAWRVVDFTVPVEMPRAAAVWTSVRSS